MSKLHELPQPLFINAAPIPAATESSPPQSSKKAAKNSGTKQMIEVDFRELPDGTLVETIEDPNDSSKSLLAVCNDGHVRYVDKLANGNQQLVPLLRSEPIIRNLRLPNGSEEYESVKDLTGNIFRFLNSTLDLSPEHLLLLTGFVLSSWLVEKLPVAPYVAFIGPPGSGKTTALRILDLLCRRSLLTTDISSAAFYDICDRITTTVLIDEAATVNNQRELFHMLRAGTTQGFVTVRKGKSFKSYGLRAVTWTELPNDAALNSRCILIPMKSSERSGLLRPNDPLILSAAQNAQKQLLQFRFLNYKTASLPKISGEEEVQPRTRDLFRALALPMYQEPELCEALLQILRQQQSLRNMLSENQSAVLDVLFDLIHVSPGINGIRTKDLAGIVNETLMERGELKITDRKLGNVLTSLNLTRRERTKMGWVLVLNRETKVEIHSLTRRHGIKTEPSPEQAAKCDICQAASGAPNKPTAESKRTAADSLADERGERSERCERAKPKRQKRTRSARAGRSGGKS